MYLFIAVYLSIFGAQVHILHYWEMGISWYHDWHLNSMVFTHTAKAVDGLIILQSPSGKQQGTPKLGAQQW